MSSSKVVHPLVVISADGDNAAGIVESTVARASGGNDGDENSGNTSRGNGSNGNEAGLLRVVDSYMAFFFTFTVCAVLPGVVQLWNYALTTGGPKVIIGAWIGGSVLSTLTAISLAEICSVHPKAGSVYHWTSVLAPRGMSPFVTYLCGWTNMIGNLANSASFASGTASIIRAAVILHDGRDIGNGSQVLMSLGFLWLWILLNLFRIDQQGWINSVSALIQIGGTVALIVMLLRMTPSYQSATFVFKDGYNGSGISSLAYVSCLGLLVPLYGFDGFDAAAHVSEETRDADKVAPKSMVLACISSAISGFILIVALLICTPTNLYAETHGYASGIDLLLSNGSDSTPGGKAIGSANEAIVNLIWYACGAYTGSFLTAVVAIVVYCSGMSSVTTAARITFALARDNALPFSSVLVRTHARTKSPIGAVLLVGVVETGLLLLQLGSASAFTAIVSISSIGFQLSYAVPIILRITVARKSFVPNPRYHLHGYAVAIGTVSALWCVATSILLFLPQINPINPGNMNYSIVVVGGVWAIALFDWLVRGRYRFTPPGSTSDLQE